MYELLLALALVGYALMFGLPAFERWRSRRRYPPLPPPDGYLVDIETPGSRAGYLYYREGGRSARFGWELTDPVAVSVPGAAEWNDAVPWAPGRRDEILERVAREVWRQRCRNCAWDIGDRWIEFRSGPERKSTIVVRAALPADVPALFHIRTNVRENRLSTEQLAALGITHDSVRALIEAGEGAWLAEFNGLPAGFAMTLRADRTIFALFVLPPYEGLGLGRALMAEAERWLFDQGFEQIQLTTGTDSDLRAHGFYRRLGWRPDGIAENNELRYVKSRADSPARDTTT